MLAARVNEYGPVENIRVEDISTPVPGADDVFIRVTVGGVNIADVGIATGAALRPPPPFSPGVEAAVTIEALGEGVTEFAVRAMLSIGTGCLRRSRSTRSSRRGVR